MRSNKIKDPIKVQIKRNIISNVLRHIDNVGLYMSVNQKKRRRANRIDKYLCKYTTVVFILINESEMHGLNKATFGFPNI